LYVVGGGFGIGGVVAGGGGGGGIIRGGNTKLTRTSPFILTQPFVFTECRLEWIFGKSIKGGWCDLECVFEDDGFVEAAEECHGVESEDGGEGALGVGFPSDVPFGLFPIGILSIQLVGSDLSLH